MSQIHVIASAGNPQFDLILSGVYGKFQADTSKFAVAPEFYPISPLFGYMDRAGMKIDPRSVAQIDAPDGKENLMRAQLMLNLARRWEDLYQGVAPQVRDMAAAMTQADAQMVANGVRNHLITMGMRGYMVPVQAVAEAGDIDGAVDERGLIARLHAGRIGGLTVCNGESPIDCGSEVYSTGIIQADAQPPQTEVQGGASTEDAPVAVALVAQVDAPPSAPWTNYPQGSGVTAKVAGTMLVCAQTPAGAVEAANWVIREQANHPGLMQANMTITRVLQTQCIAPQQSVSYEDEDEGSYFERE